MKLPKWALPLGVGLVVLVVVMLMYTQGTAMARCPGTLVYCPGVGCVSGRDKCVAGAKGGPSVVFSQEPFDNWPGVGVASNPPTYGDVSKEAFTPAADKKTCAGNYRSDGPCLMDFPGF
jgi:hypothetical protein